MWYDYLNISLTWLHHQINIPKNSLASPQLKHATWLNNSYSNWEWGVHICWNSCVDNKLDGESIKCTVHTFAHAHAIDTVADDLKIGIKWCVVWRYWILSENFHLHHAHHSPPLGKWIILFSYGHFLNVYFSSFWLIYLWVEHVDQIVSGESSPIIDIIHTWYICIRN
jgi:hypothetical protein